MTYPTYPKHDAIVSANEAARELGLSSSNALKYRAATTGLRLYRLDKHMLFVTRTELDAHKRAFGAES